MNAKAPARPDHCTRTITEDSAFRVIVARTTSTVAEICRWQEASGALGRTLGDLVTATLLFRETMAPGLRVQGILRMGTGPHTTLVADSAPEGLTRGLIQGPRTASLEPREGDLLQMMRTLQNGAVNQGVVKVEGAGGITRAMMAYMRESEQVDTMLSVGTLFDGDRVVGAGGYMVQLLPEVGKGPLAVMAERLEDFRNIDRFLTPEFEPAHLLEEILYLMPHIQTSDSPVVSHCWCSESRLLGAIATLQRSEIQAMIQDGQILEIDCDYCRKEYRIQPSALQGLLDPS